MNDIIIQTVHEHKHLGVIFQEDGKWNSHINTVSSKAWSRIGLLRKLKFVLKRQCLEKLYFSFIRPLLDYSDIVWDSCSIELQRELEAIQVEAARIVTGTTKLCNMDKLYNELK